MDDIGIAANNATDLTRNIQAVFKWIRQAGLKLTIEKCHFGVRQVDFLGIKVAPERILPQGFTAISGFRELLRKLRSQDG